MKHERHIHAPKRPTENEVARGVEQATSFRELIGGYRAQAEMYINENPAHAKAFAGALKDYIVNAKPSKRRIRALSVYRDNPFYVPDHIPESPNHRAAFLIAFAEKLDEPAFNQ